MHRPGFEGDEIEKLKLRAMSGDSAAMVLLMRGDSAYGRRMREIAGSAPVLVAAEPAPATAPVAAEPAPAPVLVAAKPAPAPPAPVAATELTAVAKIVERFTSIAKIDVDPAPAPAAAEMKEDCRVTIHICDQLGGKYHFKIKPTSKMHKIFDAYAERRGVPVDALRFDHAGSLVDGEQTCADSNLEDGDQIDV